MPAEPARRPVMLITGGSRGIGAAVAVAAAGTHDLVLAHTGSHDVTELLDRLQAHGAAVESVTGDVADEADVMRWFVAADERFGRLDALVNNAGIAGGYGGIATVTSTMLRRLFDVNVTGAFLCAREAVVRMSTARGNRGGAIVNISSKAAVLGGSGEWVHYAATKGAIDTLTVGLAKEVATEGIRVNGVRPGLIESDFHDHAPPGRVERMAPAIPMQRSGSAAEVAEAVVWLASPAASYVTGAFIDVTGGR